MTTQIPSRYEEDFKIRFYESDYQGCASIISICNFYEEVAFNHAARPGFTGIHKEEAEHGFVLSRLKICMDRLPSWREEVRMATWLAPFEIGGRFIVRNFCLEDRSGNLIGQGMGSVAVFNLQERKPVPVPEYMAIMPAEGDPVGPEHFTRLESPERIDASREFTVGLSDIDLYRHVNTVRYLQWAMDTVPLEISRKWQCCGIEAQFKAEVHAGNTVLSKTQIIEEGDRLKALHRIECADQGTETTVLNSLWKRTCSC